MVKTWTHKIGLSLSVLWAFLWEFGGIGDRAMKLLKIPDVGIDILTAIFILILSVYLILVLRDYFSSIKWLKRKELRMTVLIISGGATFLFLLLTISLLLTTDITKRHSEFGEWHDNTFIYNEPFLAFTKMVTWQDSLKTIVFTIEGKGAPPPSSFIYWRVDVDKARNRVKTAIDFEHGKNVGQFIEMKRSSSNGEFTSGIRFSENRKMSLTAKIDEGTVPVILRVYITSYEVDI